MNSDHQYLINSIYRSTEGEGVFVGIPQIFIRYQGCSIGCANCDSKDTWEFDLSRRRTLRDITGEIDRLATQGTTPLKRVSITGGDPLNARFVAGLVKLCEHLKERQYFINIEASGSKIVEEVFELVDFISFDYKTPSTKVATPLENLSRLIANYPHKFQIKSVVSNVGDYENAKSAYLALGEGRRDYEWVLTPCFLPGQAFDFQFVAQLMDLNARDGSFFRVIGQQHKWVYGPDRKNV